MFLIAVECIDDRHFFIRQLEIEYGNVLLDMFSL